MTCAQKTLPFTDKNVLWIRPLESDIAVYITVRVGLLCGKRKIGILVAKYYTVTIDKRLSFSGSSRFRVIWRSACRPSVFSVLGRDILTKLHYSKFPLVLITVAAPYEIHRRTRVNGEKLENIQRTKR